MSDKTWMVKEKTFNSIVLEKFFFLSLQLHPLWSRIFQLLLQLNIQFPLSAVTKHLIALFSQQKLSMQSVRLNGEKSVGREDEHEKRDGVESLFTKSNSMIVTY